MEWDGATTTIGLLCVALFALPFALDYRSRMKKKARLHQALHDAAARQQRLMGAMGTCAGVALGMDKSGKHLYFFNEREANPAVQRVNLAEVRSCHALRDGRPTKAAEADGMPATVELCLLPTDGATGETRLVLYRSAYGTALDGEVQFATEWARTISERLNRK